jgi:hypothetical protein
MKHTKLIVTFKLMINFANHIIYQLWCHIEEVLVKSKDQENLEKSTLLKIKIKKNEYHFTTLNKNVELKCLPIGYHSSKAPSNNGCDYCNQRFRVEDEHDGIMLICGHAYHHKCFGEK